MESRVKPAVQARSGSAWWSELDGSEEGLLYAETHLRVQYMLPAKRFLLAFS